MFATLHCMYDSSAMASQLQQQTGPPARLPRARQCRKLKLMYRMLEPRATPEED